MSDSDDFGGLGATTPNISRKLPPSNAAATAGPSRAGGASNRKKAPPSVIAISNTSDDDEVVKPKRRTGKRQRKDEEEAQEEEAPGHEDDIAEVGGDDEDDEVREIERPTTKTSKGAATKARGGSKKPTMVNGKSNVQTAAAATTAAKGKGKAKPTTKAAAKASSSRQKQAEPEEIEVDPIEVLDDDEMDVEEPPVGLARAINNAAGWSKKSNGKAPAKQRGDAALEERLQQAHRHIEDLTRQLEELNQVRRTEAEQLLERMEVQYQAQLQAKESLIQELTTQLQKEHPLLRAGKGAFEILTREEANKEMEGLQKQVKAYKEAVRERDYRLQSMEEEKETLKQAQNDLRVELQLEVERANALVAKAQQRPPPSAARPRAGGILPSSEDPKIVEVIRFYEDLTNLLVPNMKLQQGKHLGLDEWGLNCLYTHRDVSNKDIPTKSLNFTLRLCHDIRSGESEPITSKDQLVESVHYTPHELEKETEEFREALKFLKDTFTFERDQLSLFLRTLHDYMSGEGGDGDGDEEDDDVQVIG